MFYIKVKFQIGQPAATDDERSFVVRVVSDSPLFVQELQSLPKMNIVLQRYCFGEKVMSLSNAGTSAHRGFQGTKTVLMEEKVGKTYLFKVFRVDCLAQGGGTVLLYLVVNDECITSSEKDAISFSIEVNCRGMICRTADGLEKHNVISKGKKFGKKKLSLLKHCPPCTKLTFILLLQKQHGEGLISSFLMRTNQGCWQL